MPTIAEILARELDKPLAHVQNVIDLLDQGNTIPFIARYRKELHGSMDDTALRTLEDRLSYLRNLDQRRQEVKNAIDGQGKLTDELSAAIDSAATLAEVEDLYRPYKQKRRTRATVAREKGLEPLALLLLDQGRDCPAPEEAARDYVDPEKGVETAGRRPPGGQRHRSGAAVGRCRHPQDPAGAAAPPGTSAESGRHGGGHRLPAVLRL